MSMQVVCTSKKMWAELSYKLGPCCLGQSFMWAELAWAELIFGRVVRNSPNGKFHIDLINMKFTCNQL